MAEQEPTVPLGSLVEIRRGSTYKSALLGQDGPVLLGLSTIARNGGFRADSLRTYGGDSPERMLVRPGGIYASLKDVTQSADLLGSVARLPLQFQSGRLTQDTVRLDVVSDLIDPDFLYWQLLTPQYRDYCRAHATGTTNLGLPRDDFLAYPLWLPPLDVQRRIAGVLGNLDDLIDTNRRLILAARDLAATIFLRLETSGVTTFGEIAELRRVGVHPAEMRPDEPFLGLEHFAVDGAGVTSFGACSEVTSAGSRFEVGDVLFGKLRPYFRKFDRLGFPGICTNEAWVLRPRAPYSAAFVYSLVQSQEFVDWCMAGAGGTRMPRANWEHACSFPVAVPVSGADSQATEESAEALWSAVWALREEGAGLERTRDELLPSLMSGQVVPGEVA